MAYDYQRELVTLIEQREEKHYAWLRHILLLASGSLSVLISLRTGVHTVGFAHVCISAALASLGLGILLGAVSLHGEVTMKNVIIKRICEEAIRALQNPGTADEPVTAQLPFLYRAAQKLCYLSLAVSVSALVTYAIIAT